MKIPVSKATQRAIARGIHRAEKKERALAEAPLPNGWRRDLENAPSPCLGWCIFPAGEEVRMIYRHRHDAGSWTAYSITQTVFAWQELPRIPSLPRPASGDAT